MIPSASRMKRTGLNPAEPPSAWPDDLRGDSDVERRLRAVLDVTSSLTGQDFFASLVRLLAAALEVRFAFVSQCTDAARTSVRTLAFWSGDKFGENFRYAVAGTPCERVMQNEVWASTRATWRRCFRLITTSRLLTSRVIWASRCWVHLATWLGTSL